jgi:hypothetical protein
METFEDILLKEIPQNQQLMKKLNNLCKYHVLRVFDEAHLNNPSHIDEYIWIRQKLTESFNEKHI